MRWLHQVHKYITHTQQQNEQKQCIYKYVSKTMMITHTQQQFRPINRRLLLLLLVVGDADAP